MSNNEEYAKKQEGKPRVQLLSPKFLREMARVIEHGNMKYPDTPWYRGLPRQEVIGSIMRHALKMLDGEIFDESGFPHETHIAVNAMFLFELTSKEAQTEFLDWKEEPR
jgi:hypothetical protein